MASSVTCDDCQSPVSVTAQRCRCGWVNTAYQETTTREVPSISCRVSFAESKAAYQKVSGSIKRLTEENTFNAKEHWRKVLAKADAGSYAHMVARQALTAMGVELPSEQHREPGQDDEEIQPTQETA